MVGAGLYPLTKVFSFSPLTLTLSPRRGEREAEEETFCKPYETRPYRWTLAGNEY
jgi:hypothetical protein